MKSCFELLKYAQIESDVFLNILNRSWMSNDEINILYTAGSVLIPCFKLQQHKQVEAQQTKTTATPEMHEICQTKSDSSHHQLLWSTSQVMLKSQGRKDKDFHFSWMPQFVS